MTRGRTLLVIAVAACAATGSLACARSRKRVAQPSPEDVWLSRIGTGPAQTARVCALGATDRVSAGLCDKTTPPVRGLQELYRAVRLDQPFEMLAATNTHSLAGAARIVSALNPRVLVFQSLNDPKRTPTRDQVEAVGFARGEQLVEMVALDPATREFNFYLLRFEQACNRTRCTPEDLLTERIEHEWTGWTLYSDRDLQDTPLDCTSCHQPLGPGTRKQLLMRQVFDPWMHWGHFRGGDERALCPEQPADGSRGKTVVVADGLDLLRAVEGPAGRYAGLPVAKLHAAKSGEIFVAFYLNSDSLVRITPERPLDYPYDLISYLKFQTREVLCERFHTGQSPTWERHRRESRERGIPVPFYGPDVTDPRRRAEVLAGRTAFLRRHADDDAFDVAASFVSDEAAGAVGFLPTEEESAPEILRSMCVRCHGATTDPHLRRAQFNAEAIERIEPPLANAIRQRLSLPRTSAWIMPPLRAGELPSWAIARIERYLRDHCTEPGACG